MGLIGILIDYCGPQHIHLHCEIVFAHDDPAHIRFFERQSKLKYLNNCTICPKGKVVATAKTKVVMSCFNVKVEFDTLRWNHE